MLTYLSNIPDSERLTFGNIYIYKNYRLRDTVNSNYSEHVMGEHVWGSRTGSSFKTLGPAGLGVRGLGLRLKAFGV